jgi:hypothetical protein
MKKCIKCNIEKEDFDFVKNTNKCKGCDKLYRLCIHNKRKSRCNECNEIISEICEHNKRKYRCKDCKGFGICEHNKHKSICKLCNGSQICIHLKYKQECKECDGNKICEHNKIKYICKECNGSQICSHNKRKQQCLDCGGSSFCVHKKQKKYCKLCTPNSNAFCKICKLYCVTKQNNYLCADCNPDKTKREKTKELTIKQLLIDNGYNFKHNKKIPNDIKSIRYPDFKFECNNYYLILEVDEYKHKYYSGGIECEQKRMNEIMATLEYPCKFIRYNPDNNDYTKQESELLKIIDKYINLEELDNIEPIYLYY